MRTNDISLAILIIIVLTFICAWVLPRSVFFQYYEVTPDTPERGYFYTSEPISMVSDREVYTSSYMYRKDNMYCQLDGKFQQIYTNSTSRDVQSTKRDEKSWIYPFTPQFSTKCYIESHIKVTVMIFFDKKQTIKGPVFEIVRGEGGDNETKKEGLWVSGLYGQHCYPSDKPNRSIDYPVYFESHEDCLQSKKLYQ